LRAESVEPPPQGYWNKVRAGKKVPDRPRPPARRPGGSGRCYIDNRLAPFIPRAPEKSSDGPFESALVPENLEDLREIELKAIGKVGRPKSLERTHPGLRDFLAKEARRRAKVADFEHHWDRPKFDNPLDQRRLRILNAILLVLAKRGHGGKVSEKDEDFEAHVVIGNTMIGVSVEISGRHKRIVRSGYHRHDPALPASTNLTLKVWAIRDTQKFWRDEDGPLETRIAEIAAELIVVGEATFREHLRLEEERLEQARIAEEKRRLEMLEALNRKRVEKLHESADLLRRAKALRALVDEVGAAIEGSGLADALYAWRRWVLAEADKIDPILSGHIHEHLLPPSLD